MVRTYIGNMRSLQAFVGWRGKCLFVSWVSIYPILWYICFRCLHHGKPDFHMSFVHLDNLQRLNQFWNQCSNSSLHGYQGTDSYLRGNVEPFFVTVILQRSHDTHQHLPSNSARWGLLVFPIWDQRVKSFTCLPGFDKVNVVSDFHT